MRDWIWRCGPLTKGYVIAALPKLIIPWRVSSVHCWQGSAWATNLKDDKKRKTPDTEDQRFQYVAKMPITGKLSRATAPCWFSHCFQSSSSQDSPVACVLWIRRLFSASKTRTFPAQGDSFNQGIYAWNSKPRPRRGPAAQEWTLLKGCSPVIWLETGLLLICYLYFSDFGQHTADQSCTFTHTFCISLLCYGW